MDSDPNLPQSLQYRAQRTGLSEQERREQVRREQVRVEQERLELRRIEERLEREDLPERLAEPLQAQGNLEQEKRRQQEQRCEGKNGRR
jgi:hypothetical protein